MSALRLREWEAVSATGEVLAAGTEHDVKRATEELILAGRTERVRIYDPRSTLAYEATRVGPHHVSWYSKGRNDVDGR